MNANKKYGTIINEKFTDLSFPGISNTWAEMEAILDREMPKEKKRRFPFWAIFSSALIISLTCLAVCIYGKRDTTLFPGQEKISSKHSTIKTTTATPAAITNTSSSSKTAPKAAIINSGGSEKNDASNVVVLSGTTESNERMAPKQEARALPAVKQTAAPVLKIASKSNGRKLPAGAVDDVPTLQAPVQPMVPATTYAPDAANRQFVYSFPLSVWSQFKHTALKTSAATDSLTKNPVIRVDMAGTGAETAEKDSATAKANIRKKSKGWVFGAGINYNRPLSNQEMSTVSINGRKNTLIDFIPSLYAQYHFNSNWYIESSFQFSSPQYVPNNKLSSQLTDIDVNKREENAIWLNKLFYLNVPVSVHFRPLPNLTIGTGIQYSYLKRSIFSDELATWENGPNGWSKTASTSNVLVKSNSTGKVKVNSNNGNGGNNGNGNNGNNGNGNNGNGNNGNGGNGNGNGNGGNNGNNGNGNNGNGNNGNGGNGNGNGNGGNNGNGNNGNGNGNNGNNGNGGNGNNGGGNNGGGNNGSGNGNSGNGNSGNGSAGGGTTISPALNSRLDTVSQTLRSSDWRVLFDMNYQWKRINIGLRYNYGLNNYINTKSGASLLPVKDRNQALQLYLRYDLLDRRRKK